MTDTDTVLFDNRGVAVVDVSIHRLPQVSGVFLSYERIVRGVTLTVSIIYLVNYRITIRLVIPT